MALRLEDKKALVAEVAQVAASAHSAVAAEYRGLTVSEMTELRKQAREGGVYLRVVKNTLARRAVEGTDFECMQEGLQGLIVIVFVEKPFYQFVDHPDDPQPDHQRNNGGNQAWHKIPNPVQAFLKHLFVSV